MPSIFINYRSGDTEDVAGLVERDLSGRFGAEVFFRASKSIDYGSDWTRALLRAVWTSDVLLAFIGPHWLDTDGAGRRRIDREDDWTRREIVEAFRHDVRVIPVLVGAAQPLRAADLPADLAQLALCQYARLGHRSQGTDLDMLAAQLAKLVPGLTERLRTGPGEGAAGEDARGPGGTVNNAGRDVNNAGGDINYGVQAENIHGGVYTGGARDGRER